jgi:hypothetical protein
MRAASSALIKPSTATAATNSDAIASGTVTGGGLLDVRRDAPSFTDMISSSPPSAGSLNLECARTGVAGSKFRARVLGATAHLGNDS